jgi:hypothetical protein
MTVIELDVKYLDILGMSCAPTDSKGCSVLRVADFVSSAGEWIISWFYATQPTQTRRKYASHLEKPMLKNIERYSLIFFLLINQGGMKTQNAYDSFVTRVLDVKGCRCHKAYFSDLQFQPVTHSYFSFSNNRDGTVELTQSKWSQHLSR